ncbi:MAG: hypothetical protein JW719_04315 [Pirellulales bacterium]|nr:hypothetical protein [Pirellulales bacterium]
MPIEFPCGQCGKLLRTADDAAGRQARCPACGAVTDVPHAVDEVVQDREPFAGPTSPFGAAAIEGPDDFVNPYQAPADVAAAPFQPLTPAIERVRAPAICLIVMASMQLAICVAVTALYTVLLFVMSNDPEFRGRDENLYLGFGMMIGYGVLGIALAGLMLAGAVHMKNLRHYGLALTSAILMLLPCFWPCWILAMPFSVWALIVLANGDVRAAFR